MVKCLLARRPFLWRSLLYAISSIYLLLSAQIDARAQSSTEPEYGLYSWGFNALGQMGLGKFVDEYVPTRVTTLGNSFICPPPPNTILYTDFTGRTTSTGPLAVSNISWSSELGQEANASNTFLLSGSATGFIGGYNLTSGTLNPPGEPIPVSGNVETAGPWNATFTFTPSQDLDLSFVQISSYSIAGGGGHQGGTKSVRWELQVTGGTLNVTRGDQGDEAGGSAPIILNLDFNGVKLLGGQAYTFKATVSSPNPSGGNNIALNAIRILEASDQTRISIPADLSALQNIKKVSPTPTNSFFLTNDGQVYVTGFNATRTLGIDSRVSCSDINPASVSEFTRVIFPEPTNIVDFTNISDRRSLFLSDDGDVFVSGQGSIAAQPTVNRGMLGLGEGILMTGFVPEKIPTLDIPFIKSISSTATSAIALDSDGHVWFWGNNDFNESGLGEDGVNISEHQVIPRKITTFQNNNVVVTKIASGSGHHLALDSDGNVWSWGGSRGPELGLSTIFFNGEESGIRGSLDRPTKIPGLPRIKNIWASGFGSVVLSEDGVLYAFGNNAPFGGDTGPFTDGNALYPKHPLWDSQATPFEISLPFKVADITNLSSTNMFVISTEGEWWGWGFNGRDNLIMLDDVVFQTNFPQVYTKPKKFNRFKDALLAATTGNQTLIYVPMLVYPEDDVITLYATISGEKSYEGNVITNDQNVDGRNNTLKLINFEIAGQSGPFILGTPYIIADVGTITINDDGSFFFEALGDYLGEVPLITYTVENEVKMNAQATLSITVSQPLLVIATDDSQSVAPGQTATGNVLDNDKNDDDTTTGLTVTAFSIAGQAGPFTVGTAYTIPNVGEFTINADGTYEFVPATDFSGDVPVISYTVSNADNQTSSANLAIKVNSLSVLSVNSVEVNEGSPFAVFEALIPSGEPVTFSLSDGTATIGEDTEVIGNVILQYFENGVWNDYVVGTPLTFNGGIGGLIQIPIRVPIIDDNIFEGSETFKLSVKLEECEGSDIVEIPEDVWKFEGENYTVFAEQAGVYSSSVLGVEEFTFDDLTPNTFASEEDPIIWPGVGKFTAGMINSHDIYGGAKRTNYISQDITLELDNPANFFGFWWSAGGRGDVLTLYNDDQLLLRFTTNDIILSEDYDGCSEAWKIDGTTYYACDELFVFLNVRLDDGLTFNRVEFKGSVEADNYTVRLVDPNGTGCSVSGTGTIKDDGTGDYWIGDSIIPASAQELSDAGISLDDDRQGVIATDDTQSVAPGQTATGNVLDNDKNEDDTTTGLTVTAFSIAGQAGPFTVGTAYTIPNVGKFTINADGTYEFVPATDFSGDVPVISYTVENDQGGSDTGVLNVSVFLDDEEECTPEGALLLDYTAYALDLNLKDETLSSLIEGIDLTHKLQGTYQSWKIENISGNKNVFRTGAGVSNQATMEYTFSHPVSNLGFSIRDLDTSVSGTEKVEIRAYFKGVEVLPSQIIKGINTVETSQLVFEGTTDNTNTLSYDNGVILEYENPIDRLVLIMSGTITAGQGSVLTFEEGCRYVEDSPIDEEPAEECTPEGDLLLDYTAYAFDLNLKDEKLASAIEGIDVTHKLQGTYQSWKIENISGNKNVFRTGAGVSNQATMEYTFSHPVSNLGFSIRDLDTSVSGTEKVEIRAYFKGVEVLPSQITKGINTVETSQLVFEGTTDNTNTLSYDNGVILEYENPIDRLVLIMSGTITAGQGSVLTFEEGCRYVEDSPIDEEPAEECTPEGDLLLDYTAYAFDLNLKDEKLASAIEGIDVTHKLQGTYQSWKIENISGNKNVFRTGAGVSNQATMEYTFSHPVSNLGFSIRDLDTSVSGTEKVEIRAYFKGVEVLPSQITKGINTVETSQLVFEGTTDNTNTLSYDNGVILEYENPIDRLVLIMSGTITAGQGSVLTFEEGCRYVEDSPIDEEPAEECTPEGDLLLDYTAYAFDLNLKDEKLASAIEGIDVTHKLQGTYQSWKIENISGNKNVFRTGAGVSNQATMEYTFSHPVSNLGFSIRDLDTSVSGTEKVEIRAYFKGVEVLPSQITKGINTVETSQLVFEGTTDNTNTLSYDNGVILEYENPIDRLVLIMSGTITAGQGSVLTFEGGCRYVESLQIIANDDDASGAGLAPVVVDIFENDEFSNVDNLTVTQVGGTAAGEVSFDPETGIMTYIPKPEDVGTTVTVIYEVCDGAVCAQATVTITLDYLDPSCGCETVIENGGFETPAQSGTNFFLINQNNVPGWRTTATDGLIEFWTSGFLGVPAAEGNQFVELNANQVSALFQRICVQPGTIFKWSIKHRGRSGTDVATVAFGPSLNQAVIQQTMSTGNSAWKTYSGIYEVPEGQTETFIFLRSVSSVGGATVGNFLDDFDVKIIYNEECPDPFRTSVDFNVTDINVPVTGDVSTNDVVPAGTVYGTPQAQTGNPEGATITMNPDGTYVFNATQPGVYNYLVPVCGPGETEDCPLSPLQITVLDPLADDNAPVVNPDIATTKEETPVKIDVLANDASGNVGTDLDPSSLRITEQPANGTVTVNADGTVTYTPNAGFTGTDVFEYTVCDTGDPAICQTGTVTVTVIPADAPDVTTAADDFAVVQANADGTATASGNVLDNDSNTDPDAELTATLVTDPATLPGTLVFNADGSYTFTPIAGFAGPLEVVYTVCDDQSPASCATATYIFW
jgi:alpha-tubulin suppressor-like RCC1 family protein